MKNYEEIEIDDTYDIVFGDAFDNPNQWFILLIKIVRQAQNSHVSELPPSSNWKTDWK